MNAAAKVKLEPGTIELERLPGGRVRFTLELDQQPGAKVKTIVDDATALELATTIRKTLRVREQLEHAGDCACVECECDCHVEGESSGAGGEWDPHREKNCPCHRCECACHFDGSRRVE